MKRHLAILGSTGSIGTQALEVVDEHPDLFEVYALTANNQVDLLIEQARKYMPEVVVIANETKYPELKEALEDLPIKVWAGSEAIAQVVQMEPIDMVLTAMVGYAGLRPTIEAIKKGKAKSVIDQSLESNDEIIRLIEGVDIFRCGEHSNIVFPQIVDKQSGLCTMPPQTGEVFHHDGLDQSGFHYFIDFIDSGTIEVHPADIVIEGFAYHFVSIRNSVVVDDISLVAERIEFLVLISGETIVEPDFHSRHLLSGRVDFANRTYHRHL